MSQQTPTYALPTGLHADDLIQPDHHNRIADTLDRVLGSALQKLLPDGPLAGWLITEDKQVAAGEGLVAGCWCDTDAAQDITGLTDGLVNYVFAVATASSADLGQVAFAAQPGPTGPANAAFLGTITLDAQGQVTELDNHVDGVSRNLQRLEIRHVAGSGTVAGVPDGETVTVPVDHSADAQFVLPGAIELQVEGEDFECELRGVSSGGGFTIVATNISEQAADFVYGWTRHGIG